MIVKAIKYKTANVLIVLAKAEGFDMNEDEAWAYTAELADF